MTTEDKYKQLVKQLRRGSLNLQRAIEAASKTDPYIAHWAGKHAAYCELLALAELMEVESVKGRS